MEEAGSGPMGFPYGALLTEDLAMAILCHSGEGIFFSSRMFDQFSITSGSVNFSPQAKVELIPLNANKEVSQMIAHVLRANP